MKPIYEPRGAAKEYGDLAVNIYTGCPHGCYYCYSPNVLRRDKDEFHAHVEPRPNIVEQMRKQIEREGIKDKTIHLCFTCDPYPSECDNSVTREVIKVIKETGNHVQILTKGIGLRDLDLLDSGDTYGVTISCYKDAEKYEPHAATPFERLAIAVIAHARGIRTWISFEPVLNAKEVLEFLDEFPLREFDYITFGKLNYHPSNIDWKAFGIAVEEKCKKYGIKYKIKDSLREEMK